MRRSLLFTLGVGICLLVLLACPVQTPDYQNNDSSIIASKPRLILTSSPASTQAAEMPIIEQNPLSLNPSGIITLLPQTPSPTVLLSPTPDVPAMTPAPDQDASPTTLPPPVNRSGPEHEVGDVASLRYQTPTAIPVLSTVPDVVAPIEGERSRLVEAVIGENVFWLEVADTNAERRKGLSGRSTVAVDSGMLFVFQSERLWTFWMKDTLIPLDIIFLDSSFEIVDIQKMVPQPSVPDSDLRRYRPQSNSLYAVEINAGQARDMGIEVGMTVGVKLEQSR